MTPGERVYAALSPIALAVPNEYSGPAATYIVYRINTYPVFAADDEILYERVIVTVDLFGPHSDDWQLITKRIKTALQTAGFTRPTAVNVSGTTANQSEPGYHIAMSCEDGEYCGTL